MKVAVLLPQAPRASAALAAASQLGATAVLGVGLGPAEAPLRAAAAGMGLALAAAVDPALNRVGPRQSGQVLAALLRREQVDLLLIDAEADHSDGMLAAAAAHHLHAALLLGAEAITPAAAGGAVVVTLPLAGRRFQLQVTLPAVMVLAAGGVPAPAPAEASTAGEIPASIHALEGLSLQALDLIEPDPPSTARRGQTRPTPVKDLSRLLGG